MQFSDLQPDTMGLLFLKSPVRNLGLEQLIQFFQAAIAELRDKEVNEEDGDKREPLIDETNFGAEITRFVLNKQIDVVDDEDCDEAEGGADTDGLLSKLGCSYFGGRDAYTEATASS